MTRVLFLPGAGGSPDFWAPVARLLPADWRAHRFAWPGLGAQPHDPAIRGMDDLVTMVLARMDAPVHLVAQSMGGVIAVRAALARPGAVRSLTLTGTSGGVDVAALGGADWRADYRREFPHAAPWIAAPQEDLTARIPALVMPALLLWGDSDPISPVTVGGHLASLLPNASLHIVPGGDHGFPVTHAEQIAPMIRRHIERAD